ncbi:hypothetical protein D3C78_1656860 [compost metagenome]
MQDFRDVPTSRVDHVEDFWVFLAELLVVPAFHQVVTDEVRQQLHVTVILVVGFLGDHLVRSADLRQFGKEAFDQVLVVLVGVVHIPHVHHGCPLQGR